MPTTYAIPDGRTVMNAVTRSGFGASGGSVTSLAFQPDLIWEKTRNLTGDHFLVDSVRTVSKTLSANTTAAEATNATYFTSFNSNGYSLGSGDWSSSYTLVDWCWKAGGTAVSNTAGSITSSVSANTTAGFSVVTYTGTGANATVGHGLGVAPQMIIIKNRPGVYNWRVWHTALSSTELLFLNTTDAKQTGQTTAWNSTLPSSTVFSLGSSAGVNESAVTFVAYCFAPVAGYSAFGSYTGNGSADGPFCYTGFQPRWVMLKRTDAVAAWVILDTSRDTYNAAGLDLYPNTSDAETDNRPRLDILSNGFKLRANANVSNLSGGTYVYACFASNPLKYANAR
jgi:hypothetical protein